MPRKPKHKDSKVQVIGMVHPELREAIEAEAIAQDTTVSHLIRKVMRAYTEGRLVFKE